MPIYEYRCEHCGHEMDALQKVSDAPLVHCPACGRPALKKLISAAGFRLKGSGWYETDFKSGNKKNLHETGEKKEASKSSDKKDKVGSENKDKGSSEKKPAPKADSAPKT
jgi:putative FmdB family regulatory protein